MLKDEIINRVLNSMKMLDGDELTMLRGALLVALDGVELVRSINEISTNVLDDNELIQRFLIQKKIDGLSKRTIDYYRVTLEKWLHFYIKKSVLEWTRDDVRMHFARRMIDYPDVSKVTINNDRRNFSSFFTWLMDEGYLRNGNPMKAMKKIKVDKVIKEPIPDDQIEVMRDKLAEKKSANKTGTRLWLKAVRDQAIFELLLTTGCRIGELTTAKIKDLDLERKEIKVFGKGAKERVCYLNTLSVLRMQQWLEARKDIENEYIFVSCDSANGKKGNHARLQISGVEINIRKLGRECGFENIHPHRFRRTAATTALRKGMPIEQVQLMLGHEQIDTTMIYAKTDTKSVKYSHDKYM